MQWGSEYVRILLPSSAIRVFLPFLLALGIANLVSGVAHAAGPDRHSIQGRVVDRAGAPIAKASVRLWPYENSYAVRSRLLRDAPVVPVARAVADANGYFSIAAPEGFYQLTFEARGYAEVSAPIAPLLEDLTLPTIALPDGRVLDVRVVDAEARPVAGALVFADHRRERTRAEQATLGSARRQTGRTEADGRLRLQVAHGAVVVRAAASGFLMTSAEPTSDGALTVTLQRGVERAVTVVAGTQARSGAVLALADKLFPLALADEQGQAVVTLPAHGPQRLIAITENDEWADETVAPPTEGVAPPVRVGVKAPLPVVGTVLQAGTGEPVAGAWVWERADPANHGQADGRGRYQIALFDRSRQAVGVAARGHFPSAAGLKPEAVAAGDGPTLTLQPAVRVSGRVVDQDGASVAEVHVRARSVDRSGFRTSNESVRAISAADGTFVLGPLAPDLALSLLARRDGYATAEETVGAPGESAGPPIVIELVRGRSAYGFVVDVAGEPVAEAAAVLLPSVAPGTGLRQLVLARNELEPPQVLSDGEGRFVFDDTAPGSYDLLIKREGFAPTSIRGLEIPAGDGASEIGLITLQDGLVLEGRVVDLETEPIAGATVTVVSSGFGLRNAVTRRFTDHEAEIVSDTEGRFQVRDLAPKQVMMLQVRADGYGVTSVQNISAPRDEPVLVELVPAVDVQGIVVDPQGRGVVDASLELQRQADGSSSQISRILSGQSFTSSEAEGRFVFDDVVAGIYAMQVKAQVSDVEIDSIEVVVDQEPSPLRIELVPGAVLVGRVLDSGGCAIGGRACSAGCQPTGPGLSAHDAPGQQPGCDRSRWSLSARGSGAQGAKRSVLITMSTRSSARGRGPSG